MKFLKTRTAFSLLEILVVVTLVATAIGISTLGMANLSAEGRLKSAGDQLAAIYRLAQTFATRTGLVVTVECSGRQCHFSYPKKLEGTWALSDGGEFSLPQGVDVTQWGAVQSAETNRPPMHRVAVAPGYLGESCEAVLSGSGYLLARVTIDGMTGEHAFVLVEDGRDE